jgi:predicted MFS family arabinose efflux permease
MTTISDFYWGSFFITAIIAIILQIVVRSYQNVKINEYSENVIIPENSISNTDKKLIFLLKSIGKQFNFHSKFPSRFQLFQIKYIFIFLLAMFSDWLQGPYVYELYVSYGFDQQQIAELFVCGFGSSMIFGTIVGGLADKYGRKKMCLLYSICYIVACFTKLFPYYEILMIGRFLSGIATSLLFSVFESWMICEHNKQGFDSALLNETFTYATLGNGVVAVLAGLISNIAASIGGCIAPFIVAVFPLSLILYIVSNNWSENYGNQTVPLSSSFSRAFDFIRSDSKIIALGLGQSFFEGAMYTFVFMWTPAIKTDIELFAEANNLEVIGETTAQYLGLIFSIFMICLMIGSSIFQIFSSTKENLYKIPIIMHLMAAFSMLSVTLFIANKSLVYYSFLLFEVCCGIFYPAYGVIKSEKIPEEIRSSVMNIFRVPLNAFVILLLLKIKFVSPFAIFIICTTFHGLSFLCYCYFYCVSFTYKDKLYSYEDVDVENDVHRRMSLGGYDNDDVMAPLKLGRHSSELEMYLREVQIDPDTKQLLEK